MSRHVTFDPEALLELDRAASWYNERRSDLGYDFLQAIGGIIELIANRKSLGLRIPELDDSSGVRRAPVSRFPYQDVFEAIDDEVRILAVAHDHQQPGYWADRASN